MLQQWQRLANKVFLRRFFTYPIIFKAPKIPTEEFNNIEMSSGIGIQDKYLCMAEDDKPFLSHGFLPYFFFFQKQRQHECMLSQMILNGKQLK